MINEENGTDNVAYDDHVDTPSSSASTTSSSSNVSLTDYLNINTGIDLSDPNSCQNLFKYILEKLDNLDKQLEKEKNKNKRCQSDLTVNIKDLEEKITDLPVNVSAPAPAAFDYGGIEEEIRELLKKMKRWRNTYIMKLRTQCSTLTVA